MTFLSPYSKSDCVKRFRAAVDPAWRFGGQQPVIGWTRLGTLHAQKRISYRNSFQTVLTARLRPAGEGTHVGVSTGMSGFVLAVLIAWFAVAGLLGIGLSFSESPSSAFIALGMLAFGVVLVAVGRHFARDEAAYLTEFLIETLDLERMG